MAAEAQQDSNAPVAGLGLSQRRTGHLGLLVVVLLVAGFVLVTATGVLDGVTDRQRLESTVSDAGWLGPVVFLGMMIALVPLNVPGVLFVIPSTTLFGTPGGITLSLIGGFVGCSIGMVAARHFARPYLEPRLPARVRRWEQRISRNGFWGVAAARTVTFMLQPVDWLCGLSSVPMRTALAGTFVGLIPPTLAVSLTGGALLDAVL